jgi:SAM-dependent methyltransferase
MLRKVAHGLAALRPVRRMLIRYYDNRPSELGWTRLHPFDAQHGIRTSGLIPGYVLRAGSTSPDGNFIYAGSQPSIVRQALGMAGALEGAVFLDLGCGKGRVLAVASEFPFAEVIGVELSDVVAEQAEANMAALRHSFPERCPIRVVVGNAAEYPLSGGRLVIFLYNPFGEALVARVAERIEAALAGGGGPVTIVYYNPVWASIFDASPGLVRRAAVELDYAASEIGFGPDTSDVVAIWQDRAHAQPLEGADRAITSAAGGLRARLA